MVTFGSHTNLQHDPGFARVKFGAGQMLLETELNEMQVLSDLKMGRVIAALVGNALVGTQIEVNKEEGVLRLSGGFAFVGGRSAQIGDIRCKIVPGSRVIFRIIEREVTEKDALREYGNTDGPAVANTIADLRYDTPLSRRTVWEYQLLSVPDDEEVNDRPVSDIINTAKTGDMQAADYCAPCLTVALVDTDYQVDIVANRGKSVAELTNGLNSLSAVLELADFAGIDYNQLVRKVLDLQNKFSSVKELFAENNPYGMIELSRSNTPQPRAKLHLHIVQEV